MTVAQTQQVKRLEGLGLLDPTCKTCLDVFYPFYRKWVPGMGGPFAPSHKPSDCCESGKHPHCSCDTCF